MILFFECDINVKLKSWRRTSIYHEDRCIIWLARIFCELTLCVRDACVCTCALSSRYDGSPRRATRRQHFKFLAKPLSPSRMPGSSEFQGRCDEILRSRVPINAIDSRYFLDAAYITAQPIICNLCNQKRKYPITFKFKNTFISIFHLNINFNWTINGKLMINWILILF